MRFNKTVLLATLIALSAACSAQMHGHETFGVEPGETPVLELTGGYSYLHANAPPAQCGCFSANGGFGSVVFNVPHGFGLVADLSGVRAHSIAGTTQTISLFNYLFGVRYSMRHMSERFVPYVQGLGGGSQETSNYVAAQHLSGVAYSAGGGVTTSFGPHVGATIVQVDWMGSQVPNGGNNVQNDLRFSTGITFRLGPR